MQINCFFVGFFSVNLSFVSLIHMAQTLDLSIVAKFFSSPAGIFWQYTETFPIVHCDEHRDGTDGGD